MKTKLERFGTVSTSNFAELTTLKVGGNVSCLFQPYSIDDLQSALAIILDEGIEYKVIGNGSNLLCSDQDYDGILIKLTHIKDVIWKHDSVYVEAGYSMIALANQAIKNGLSGLEFAVGIPATVGGCIYMNAGAYGYETFDTLKEVLILKDNKISWYKRSQIKNYYRQTSFQNNPEVIILAARFHLNKADRTELEEKRNKFMTHRLDHQPLGLANCGSIFKNNDNYQAWKVVDRLKLRGYKIGNAQISTKHCNFIVTKPGAKAEEVKALIDLIILKTRQELGLELELEVECFNW